MKYYEDRIKEYKIIFSAYLIVILCLFITSVYVIYKRIRKDIFETTNSLIIIPLEFLTSKDRKTMEMML